MDRYDPVFRDQGVTRSLEKNASFVIDLRHHRLLLQGQTTFGHQEIKLCQDVGIGDQQIG